MAESVLPSGDLVDRLRSALAEAERIALAAAQSNGARWEREWAFSTHFVVPTDAAGPTAAVNVSRLKPSQRAAAEHIAANDPAHVLRSVAAHRRILERHGPHPTYSWACVCSPVESCGCMGTDADGDWPCATVLDLAAVYFPEETTDGT